MNRIEYLKKTLDTNLRLVNDFNGDNDNKFEISLCNYDSKDGLDEYIKDGYSESIASGVIKYIKVGDKKYYDSAHSKNIAHKYSTGDVLINLDGDNLLRMEVLQYIAKIFSLCNIDDIYIVDVKCIGFIGLSRTNFNKLGGYCEEFIGYGYDDTDFRNRIEKYLQCVRIELLSSFDYNETCVLHQENHEKLVNFPEDVNGISFNDDFNGCLEYNRKIMEKYLDMNIMNPNEFNGIEFGK